MTPSSSPSSLAATTEIDDRAITNALNRKFKSQGILATVKFDSELEIWLSGLSVPHPEQMTRVVAQVLGELQLPAQTVKVFGQQTDAAAPNWECHVEIQPITKLAANRSLNLESEPDRQQLDSSVCPDNNMTLAILATLLGVMPLGLVAIVYASQVQSQHATGNNLAATQSANNAKRLSVISLSISGAIGALVFLAIILPLFIGGGYISKIKEEKAASKYVKTVLDAKLNEVITANSTNNKSGISTELNATPPANISYTFKGENIIDTVTLRNNFTIVATPTSAKLHSFVGFIYTIEQGDRWVAKTEGCVSKDTNFFPPTVTIANGVVTCDANSRLASEIEN